ncbi:methane monooxygenase/ammonia monooxygenase subunit C [Candidatus Macondimonas diazotrophica]|jgi:methane/ammonia monooxygenase subunit C|uniref:Methane monooxygenase/ammonia monooxygenase subunit C n=1 Tax=Candidatus Macondimonas diazotrophica TaxID=2305248 RepID=A0A4Z0FAN4_9GAMM|nr:methane monooxygenase/ammonia monooxygenase subunit C [Candidatus Macondimonas diazotrophica]NCU01109.1 methane monooxygenase/ammonia monooxygenase subunit C [Candidatus Macondimonas diazotrophica]TFZ82822.1 methane monooxygenase/ammonia monooxygenase subunit C [Candidatus Macondimonas diazotrophica]HBG30460.1 methane monooxygenase/ammonia monooxygenase subunit C [Gammaproteobacteria bacterium]HBG52160.1 methane monooxygenase/ammonia monooxygenase subunit C [Gammaproteobacteria bacterium]
MTTLTHSQGARTGLWQRIARMAGIPDDESRAPQVPWRLAVVGTLLVGLVLGIYRWYQQTHSFTVGLDYFEQDFQTYWMRLFYIQMTIITLVGVIGVPLLWFTRPATPSMTERQELRLYYGILAFAAVASVIVVAALGLFVEADAAWHQVTIRDTDFTPTHIALFYFVIPASLVAGVLGFIWLHTRVPYFVNRVSMPLALMVSGFLLIMPNLGLNEWGHTFFYAEELFAAPIHWGFVFLGWALFAIGGFVIQLIIRIRELTRIDAPQAIR